MCNTRANAAAFMPIECTNMILKRDSFGVQIMLAIVLKTVSLKVGAPELLSVWDSTWQWRVLVGLQTCTPKAVVSGSWKWGANMRCIHHVSK